ncbi:4-hydroxy-tetrahydrodipicolinate reductase [Campylobacter ureolyticus]|uniref:4-hydroxy-tetrahydrodipicolinate reductase n=1 Tax=Campylobacter ureolyticus TaxID=827 RepID=A0AAE7EBM6_9BACT|nr:4-hydroxy-tetrahydrodipicolinate reductase [Campylobacter ureolyticus]MCR8685325.1 4-hydroxy-tetrahydrodipicolinate reductase [Campylobacter ureolyticus]QKF85205.1 4-hydroxy-tetrahydrodipicolinate reductase [Campylobacter ureolyticus]QQY36316.1 4-hydroxy-tetrahydrodipicolinate reductase [Campylobacter ureolyticus]SUX25364.1 dihydrodipicolinate reductase [Campylobacter ureolyticus]
MLKIGIYGSNGRMGKMIQECLKEYENVKVAALFDKNSSNLEDFFTSSDVVIDFSMPEGTKALLEFAKKNPKPLCIGTTGLSKDELNLMKEISKNMPILYATNMSLGVAVLNKLAFLASKALSEFDAEILEMHHRYKKDAPSGTALTLAKNVAIARNLDLDKVRVSGRDGIIGQRSKDEIAVMSLRGGDIVGRHTAGFYGNGEFIELNHTATSRATFANGAIKAAIWLSSQKNGLYDINDCLGL